MEIKRKSLKTNAILNATRTFLELLFPLITFPYVSRILGPVNIGKINFSLSIVSYFVMIAMLGISNYGIREAAKIRDDKIQLSKFVKEILALNTISSIISYAILFLLVFTVNKLADYRSLISLLSTTIFFTVIGIDWFFYAVEDLTSVTLRSFGFHILSFISLFIFVRKPEDYMNYTLISVVSSVGSNIFSIFISKRFVDYRLPIKIDIKKHLKPIMTFFFISVATTVNSSIDTTMLGFISGDKQTGFYSVANRIIRIVVSMATAATVILPRLSYLYMQNKIEEIKDVIATTLYTIMCLVIPAIVGIFLIAEPVILIISGKAYLDSIIVLKVMLPSIFFLALSNLTGSHLFMATGMEKHVIYSVFSGIVLNIVMNFFLIPKFEAFGAGIATSITEFSVCIFQLLVARKYFARLNFKFLFQFFFATLLMGISVFYLQKIHIGLVCSVLLSIMCGIFVYFSALLLMRNNTVIRIIKWRKK